ncbi:hypothetical protein N752_26510 [Desulforamulus aquiferis]|nr:hypothetical protein N752_26510 [Desulforamulus aquiferis]
MGGYGTGGFGGSNSFIVFLILILLLFGQGYGGFSVNK